MAEASSTPPNPPAPSGPPPVDARPAEPVAAPRPPGPLPPLARFRRLLQRLFTVIGHLFGLSSGVLLAYVRAFIAWA